MSANDEPDSHSHNPLVRYFRTLGPGLVAGAADDDPSGVTTYAVAGAAFGTQMLWTALVTLPLMAAIQLTCARIGLVSGRGLAGAMRQHYPRWFLYGACLLLLVANVFNIAADLAGMGDAAEMLTGLASAFWVPLFGLVVLGATVYMSYATFAAWLKWLTVVLFAYVISAVLARPDWPAALYDTVLPRLTPRRQGRVHARGNSRHHDFALPLFLAGVAGGGRRARAGAPHAPRAPRPD